MHILPSSRLCSCIARCIRGSRPPVDRVRFRMCVQYRSEWVSERKRGRAFTAFTIATVSSMSKSTIWRILESSNLFWHFFLVGVWEYKFLSDGFSDSFDDFKNFPLVAFSHVLACQLEFGSDLWKIFGKEDYFNLSSVAVYLIKCQRKYLIFTKCIMQKLIIFWHYES